MTRARIFILGPEHRANLLALTRASSSDGADIREQRHLPRLSKEWPEELTVGGPEVDGSECGESYQAAESSEPPATK
jgi:hypothetical protein